MRYKKYLMAGIVLLLLSKPKKDSKKINSFDNIFEDNVEEIKEESENNKDDINTENEILKIQNMAEKHLSINLTLSNNEKEEVLINDHKCDEILFDNDINYKINLDTNNSEYVYDIYLSIQSFNLKNFILSLKNSDNILFYYSLSEYILNEEKIDNEERIDNEEIKNIKIIFKNICLSHSMNDSYLIEFQYEELNSYENIVFENYDFKLVKRKVLNHKAIDQTILIIDSNEHHYPYFLGKGFIHNLSIKNEF